MKEEKMMLINPFDLLDDHIDYDYDTADYVHGPELLRLTQQSLRFLERMGGGVFERAQRRLMVEEYEEALFMYEQDREFFGSFEGFLRLNSAVTNSLRQEQGKGEYDPHIPIPTFAETIQHGWAHLTSLRELDEPTLTTATCGGTYAHHYRRLATHAHDEVIQQ